MYYNGVYNTKEGSTISLLCDKCNHNFCVPNNKNIFSSTGEDFCYVKSGMGQLVKCDNCGRLCNDGVVPTKKYYESLKKKGQAPDLEPNITDNEEYSGQSPNQIVNNESYEPLAKASKFKTPFTVLGWLTIICGVIASFIYGTMNSYEINIGTIIFGSLASILASLLYFSIAEILDFLECIYDKLND